MIAGFVQNSKTEKKCGSNGKNANTQAKQLKQMQTLTQKVTTHAGVAHLLKQTSGDHDSRVKVV